jgi:hypothetical protein
MKKIKIFDDIFSHNPYSCLNCVSDYIIWDVNPEKINDGDIIFFTDISLEKVLEYKGRNIKKYAWLLESPAIINQDKILELENEFDNIFTFRNDLLKLSNKYKLLLHWCCWIKNQDKQIYSKTKSLSIIASGKRQTEGHILRHSIISLFGNKMDIFGRGYNFIEDKLEGLKDYKFHIVVENIKEDYYFSEKLLDCFATGTIPIYWGCPSIGDFFNEKGILIFNNMDGLYNILKKINDEKYEELLPYAIENFKILQKYKTPEDYLKNYNIL